MGTIMKMVLSAMDNSFDDDGSGKDVGFELLRISVIAGAGFIVLNEQEPLPGFENSHRLLLASLEAMADAEDDMKQWINDSDSAALTRGVMQCCEGLIF